ncbi:MAG: hypothetical protein HFI62_12035 [Lachnospiraceae bacterium]|jgi:peptide maturation system acyl carrier-related protein|nr:hypothetical protein [Lachnospiraceae bacterium]
MKKEAGHVLEDILLDKWNIDMQSNEKLRDEKLLGDKVNMKARDLVVLLCTLEEELDIHISTQDIVDGKFDTFHHIKELICSALS